LCDLNITTLLTLDIVCGVCLEEDGARIMEARMDVNKAVVRKKDLVEIEDKKLLFYDRIKTSKYKENQQI